MNERSIRRRTHWMLAAMGAFLLFAGWMLLPTAFGQPRDRRPQRVQPREPGRSPVIRPTPEPRSSDTPRDRPPQSGAREPRLKPRTALGITAVETAFRDIAPIGRGITAAHVEGAANSYMPNAQRLNRVHFAARSGPSQPNGHATTTAGVIYGPGNLAPGITDVHCYATAHWLTEGYLRAGTPLPPIEDDRRLFNHSWIGGSGGPGDLTVLRRVDYIIDARDAIMVVGVNNGRNTTVPSLLCSAYNVIAVGSTNSSGGYTSVDGEGRCKPDITAPTRMTSFATPMVGAIAARLLEMGDRMVAENDPDALAKSSTWPTTAYANKSQVIRAVLFAGAQKVAGWRQQEGKPLDEHQGAGRVRLDHSFAIMRKPLRSIDAPMQMHGWHYATIEPGKSATYTLKVARDMGEVSLFLVWNRRISGPIALAGRDEPLWSESVRLADLDVALMAGGKEVAASRSRIDNLEHIYLEQIAEGEYEVHITRQDTLADTWDYALAWRIEEPGRGMVAEDDDEGEVEDE